MNVRVREETGVDRGSKKIALLPPSTLFGLGIALIAVLTITLFSYHSLVTRTRAADQVTHSLQTKEQVAVVLSTVKDAETGQRGYLITGEERYLEPFSLASARIATELTRLERVLETDEERRIFYELRDLTREKLSELNETVQLKREGASERALAIVLSDRGKQKMDQIRAAVDRLQELEQRSLTARNAEWQAAIEFSSFVTWGSSGLLLFCIASAAVVMSRDHRARELRTWLQNSQMRLSDAIQGEQRLERLGEHILEFLAPHLGARIASVYVAETDDTFRRIGGYALPAAALNDAKSGLRKGEGLLGQVARDGRPLRVRDVPTEFFGVESSLGGARPRELLLAPAVHEGALQAVIELGFFDPVQPADVELLAAASEMIGLAVRSSKDRTRLEEALEETQRQGEELQAQQEELRVSNEELEEQGRVLKESQVQLERSQAELEETNAQLEEQTQILETQKDDLVRAQAITEERAIELQRSNQYKSEFLANMSHELRTPLNSSLILAKLLSDNKDGNLSDEQVRFAQTIQSAGNDLLALINDILDLSKIESGKIDLRFEDLVLEPAINGTLRNLQPIAQQRSLDLSFELDASAPRTLRTDAQRLGQILKNLLANALKFTEKGSVRLRVGRGDGDRVFFEVKDTGIGIRPEHHEAVFEAFRQADGSTHRKYGGTGLGLSIARDLARRMGGDIVLESGEGSGSTFTLTLPLQPNEDAKESDLLPSRPAPRAPSQRPPAAAAAPKRPDFIAPNTEDDRQTLSADTRSILIVEDDVPFAEVLRDLCRELGFKAIVAHTAADGLKAALTLHPSAIMLDMKLPDRSGLGLLEELKRDPRTRHIPVHVASVEDLAREARELGAIGYAVKPVPRAELETAVRALEQKFTQRLRRLLIIEDDARQRDSVRELLSAEGVEIVTSATASEALEQLRQTTFDCVVMDLNLPDLSGYELLERMADQEDIAFPPVIVYTGRSLSAAEEQRLRRFSTSIIIKDARSPERLLDEATLFLHQMEASLSPERQRMLKEVRKREAALEGRRLLIVEDDVRNVFALTSLLEPKGAKLEIARNGKEALSVLEKTDGDPQTKVDLVLMDLMMPEMDGLTCIREIRKRPAWKRLPIIALTAKAMKNDQEQSLAAGANDYVAKPLDVEKLLSLIRVWMPK